MSAVSIPTTHRSKDAERFILELDRRLERFDRAVLVADWNLYTGRSRRGSAPWQLKRAALLSDDRILSWVRSAARRSWPYPLRRRLELLERVLLDTQVEQHPDVVRRRSDLQKTVVAFRPRWKGKAVNRATVQRVLRESPRRTERRDAYYAFEPLNRPLEGALRELVHLRNDRARALGYHDFAAMRLGFQGVSPGRWEALADTVAESLRGRMRTLGERFRETSGESSWYPWDLSYARDQAVPLPARYFPQQGMVPRILDAIRQWGIRTDRMRFRVIFHDVPAGGLTLAPDPPKDVRVLVHPTGGWLAYVIMFHELGHAVHSASIRAPRHLPRWHENVPGFGAFHEGLAGLFEDIPSSVPWLSAQPGVGAERAEAFVNASRTSGPVDAASQACWPRPEQLLYRNPDRDPMAEVKRFERRVFGFDDYAPLSFVDHFFIDDPVYAPNYLLAWLFAKQLTRTLRELFGEPLWPNRKVGPWLTRNWFAPGSLYDWVPRVKEVTGRPFGAEAFRSELARP